MSIETTAIVARLASTLFLMSVISGVPRSSDSGMGGTDTDGLHITDALFAVGVDVAGAVVLLLESSLALTAAAMLLDAAAEDSATKACEKLAVP